MNKEKVILAWLWCRMFQMLATRWQASKVLGYLINRLSVQFSCSVMCNSLWPHGLQHARPPCASPPPGAYSNSCPLSRWCHPAISSSVVPFSSDLQSFPTSGSFPMSQFFTSGFKILEFQLQYQSFQWIFRVDLLAVPGTLKSLLQHHSSKASVLKTSAHLLHGPTLTPVHDYWQNNSFVYTDLCWQSDVSAFTEAQL